MSSGSKSKAPPAKEWLERGGVKMGFPWRVVADDPIPEDGALYPVILENGAMDLAQASDGAYDSPHSGELKDHLRPILWYFVPEPRPSEFGFAQCDSCQCWVPVDEIKTVWAPNVGSDADVCARCRGESDDG